MRRWEPEDERLLAKLYPDTNAKVLADVLGRATTSINAKAKMMGLCKSQEFVLNQLKEARAAAEERERKREEEANRGKRKIGTGLLEVIGNVRIHRMI